MTTTWLPGARIHDLHPAIGNGPFKTFLGVTLHVNVDEHGTPASFWGNGNPGQVCPNFQVFKDGSVDQMLPFDWQPWCQISGNFNYAAIETAGLPSEPLTAAQVATIARILAVYVREHGMKLTVTDRPGSAGLITHKAGGAAWGGHDCPGDIRTAQRPQILSATRTLIANGTTTTEEDMPLSDSDVQKIADAVWSKGLAYTSPVDGKTTTAPAGRWLAFGADRAGRAFTLMTRLGKKT